MTTSEMLLEIARIRTRLRELVDTTAANDLEVARIGHQQREIKAILTVVLDDLDRLDERAKATPTEGA